MPSLRLYLNTWNSGGGEGELENDKCLSSMVLIPIILNHDNICDLLSYCGP